MKIKFTALGFSLVELIVAVAITGILLVGTSVFFTQQLQQMTTLESQNDAHRDHFIFQEILRKKFMQATGVQMEKDRLILSNNKKSATPFTFMGLEEDRVVLKDFFLFQGIENQKTVADFPQVPLPSGMAYANGHYYVSSYADQAIYECKAKGSCIVFIKNIKQPLGLSTNGIDLFVTLGGEGKVIKIHLNNALQSVVSDAFKQPTGLAHYQKGGEHYLFVADSKANQIKRVNLQNEKVETVMGLGQDIGCQSSALFCALEFPTALAIWEDALYVADSGHGRILKVSEPDILAGIATDLNLEFEIDPGIILEKLVIGGNIEGEHLDGEKTNLVGNTYGPGQGEHEGEKVFQNPIFLLEEFDSCSLNQNLFTSQAIGTMGFQVGDSFQVEGTEYKIEAFFNKINCQSDEEAPAVWKFETQVSPKPSGQKNKWGYGKNPGEVILALKEAVFNQSGFQTLEIETFKMGSAVPAQRDERFIRVGNGILGSLEDPVEVWMEDLMYPSGLSVQGEELWVVEDKGTMLKKFDLESRDLKESVALPEKTEKEFAPFDFTSSFPVMDFMVGSGGVNLLELSFRALLNENKSQPYILNVALPLE